MGLYRELGWVGSQGALGFGLGSRVKVHSGGLRAGVGWSLGVCQVVTGWGKWSELLQAIIAHVPSESPCTKNLQEERAAKARAEVHL